MKKTLIVSVVLVLVLGVLALPAAIGWLIRDQAGPPLEDRLSEADIEWDRGWFRSAMRVVDPDFRADVRFGHLSVAPPGWLTIDGRVILEQPSAAVDFDGRIGLGLESELHAQAPSLRVDGPVEWEVRQPVVDLRAANDTLRLTGRADTLRIADGPGNRLPLANPNLDVVVEESGRARLAATLTVTASRAGLPESRLVVRMAPLAPGPLEQLVEGLLQLASTERQSAAGGLAAVGVVSAWQQLGEQGMVVELEALELDGEFSLSGRWAPGERRFSLNGGGSRDAVLAWWSNATGLAGQSSPQAAETAARIALQDLAADGLVTVDDGDLRVELDSVPVH